MTGGVTISGESQYTKVTNEGVLKEIGVLQSFAKIMRLTTNFIGK